ncbi:MULTISPECIES: hypothetical protein [unclassified Bacillus (in: firmicutes)]|uniref:hypothetical protein n=1 Tax=Bacillaceae TaxID=186817 RepID=UPI000BF4267C|nr:MULTISPECIES: hypothetical protein [unclassified Bacillus (in: firmicutes)]PEZ81875.1 hypothetical protein CN380_09640 [Bacillus sp. AFS017274]
MSNKRPDVVIIVRDEDNFENIAKIEIIGSASPCRKFLRVGAPISDVVLCMVRNGFVNAQAENAVIFFRPR